MTSLEDLDGVGSSRATMLRAAGFETVTDVGRASRAELTAVSGIGSATAEAILESAADMLGEPQELSYEESKTRERAIRQRASDREAVVVGDRLEEASRHDVETTHREKEPVRRETERSNRCRPPSSTALESAIDEARERGRSASAEPTRVRGALLQRVLEADVDEAGRVGSTPLTEGDVDVDVTVTFRPSESFGPWLERAVKEGELPDGIGERELRQLRDLEPRVLEWIDADPEHAARFVLDPSSALADIAPEKAPRLRSVLGEQALSAHPMVSLRSLSVGADGGGR